MKTFLPQILTAGALLVSPLYADFEPRIVSSDAQWVVHADLEALRASTLGKEIIDAATKAQAEHNNSAVKVQVDVAKLLTTVGSVTAYGTKFTKKSSELDGALVVEGTADLRKIAEGYVAQATVSTPDKILQVSDFPLEAYQIGNSERDGIFVAFPKEPIILISKSKEQILKAHQVYLGKAPSLKGTKSSLGKLLAGNKNVYLRAASVVPSGEVLGSEGPQTRLLQMTESAAVSIGESGDNAIAHIELVATSDALGDKLLKIVQGLAAMASLAESKDKHLAEFLQSIDVKRDERNVTVDFSYPTARLIEMSQTIRENHKPKPPKTRSAPEGKVIATWVADLQLGDGGPSPETFQERIIENVALTQGCTIVLTAGRTDGENGRLDMVEITPSGGGAALRFEAEQMVLRAYQRENVPTASGGKVVAAQGNHCSARFQFPAADGNYTIKVRYVDESDGAGTFSVSLVQPEVEAK